MQSSSPWSDSGPMDEDGVWNVRHFVYAWFAREAGAPRSRDIADGLGITPERVARALGALHEKHALFLDPGTGEIRMAHPFSAVPTPFRVDVREKSYWANCAWDCFGVVAALHAPEAAIESSCASSGEAIRIEIAKGRVQRDVAAVAHFQVPFRNWYDDLITT